MPAGGLAKFEGIQIARHEVPIAQMDDPARWVLRSHLCLDTDDAEKSAEKFDRLGLKVIDPSVREGMVRGDGLGRFVVLGHGNYLKRRDAVGEFGRCRSGLPGDWISEKGNRGNSEWT